ncbi:hypothetical protein Golomagni_07334 [Golovinomyces magnicellulatus]|nr:hypothetical protein Golomagni_07334 [Golovinomyces magnicellulatus]
MDYHQNNQADIVFFRRLELLPMLCACSVSSASTRSSPVVLLLRLRPRVSSAATRPSTSARTLPLRVRKPTIRIEIPRKTVANFDSSYHPHPRLPHRCWLRPELLLPPSPPQEQRSLKSLP